MYLQFSFCCFVQVSTDFLCINIYYAFCVVFVASDVLFFVLREIIYFCDLCALKGHFAIYGLQKRTIRVLCGPAFSPLLWHVCIYVCVRMRVGACLWLWLCPVRQ